jgi:hypothetical protein
MEARHTQCEGGRRREAVRNRERERVEGRECWAEGRRRGKEREEGEEGEKVPTNAAQLRKPARFFLSRREQQGVRQVRCGPRRRRRRCAPRFGPRGACVRACVRVCLFGWRGSGGWLARAHVLVSCDGPSAGPLLLATYISPLFSPLLMLFPSRPHLPSAHPSTPQPSLGARRALGGYRQSSKPCAGISG